MVVAVSTKIHCYSLSVDPDPLPSMPFKQCIWSTYMVGRTAVGKVTIVLSGYCIGSAVQALTTWVTSVQRIRLARLHLPVVANFARQF